MHFLNTFIAHYTVVFTQWIWINLFLNQVLISTGLLRSLFHVSVNRMNEALIYAYNIIENN